MARIKLPKEPKEPKPPREPKQPKEPKPPKPPKEPKQPKMPKVPKEPKAPKEPKLPKEPKPPKEPKQPKVPKLPKEPKPPKQPKEPKQPRQPKVPKVPKEPKLPKVPREPKQPPKMRIKATILKKTPPVVPKKVAPNGEKPKKRNTTATKKLSSSEPSSAYEEDVKVDEDDSVDANCTDEFDVQLTDIANIVIGDLKQVQVNETPFNMDPAQLTVVYSSEVSKSDCVNAEQEIPATGNWEQEKVEEECVDNFIVEGSFEEEDGVSMEDEHIGEGEEVIEVYDLSQCYPTIADTVSEEIIVNGDCDMKSPKPEHAESEFENTTDNSVDTASHDPTDEDIELSLDGDKDEIDKNGCEMMTAPSTETGKMDCDAADQMDVCMVAEEPVYTSECPTEELSKLDISEVPPDSVLSPSTAASVSSEVHHDEVGHHEEECAPHVPEIAAEERLLPATETAIEQWAPSTSEIVTEPCVPQTAEIVTQQFAASSETTEEQCESLAPEMELCAPSAPEMMAEPCNLPETVAEQCVPPAPQIVAEESAPLAAESETEENAAPAFEFAAELSVPPATDMMAEQYAPPTEEKYAPPARETVEEHTLPAPETVAQQNTLPAPKIKTEERAPPSAAMATELSEPMTIVTQKYAPPTSQMKTEPRSSEYVSDLESQHPPEEVVEEKDDEMSADEEYVVLDDSEIDPSDAGIHQLAALACCNAYRPLPVNVPSASGDVDAQLAEYAPDATERPAEPAGFSNSSMSLPSSLSDESAYAPANVLSQPPHLSPSLLLSEYETRSEWERSSVHSLKTDTTVDNDASFTAQATPPSGEVAGGSSKKTASKNNAAKRLPKEATKSRKSSFVPLETNIPPKKRGRKKSTAGEGGTKAKESAAKKKSSKEDSTSEEDSPVKSSEKRRRSKRIKSKPEYIEKKEEVKLLASLKGEKDKCGQESDTKRESDAGSGGAANEQAPKKLEHLVRVAESTDMPPFQLIGDNEYHTERSFSKDAERMICDCTLTKEEIIRGERGCGEDCLNRLLLIECCSRCTLGERCTNKRFQKKLYAKCEAYKTQKKGYGLRVLENVPSGTFLMEYVGEVINSDEFEDRAVKYAREKIPHFYFMSLKSDCIIDATIRGNYSRFINHSCEPNAETQKWTVQGELRVGFFSKREISAGEEVTFDYQLQRYGKQAQRCYCEAPSCTGWIGDDPDKQVEDITRKEKKKKKREEYVDWETALEEISQVGLINRHQTLNLNRLMVHAKELPIRMQILQLIEEGHPACRRLFVDYHGLPIIWSWMVDCGPEHDELRIQLLKTLMALPITNKTILIDSKVFSLVEQWAFAVEQKIQSEVLSAQSVLESVEDIASAEETPVSELAQKVLNQWSTLREAYRIPRKERIQQMKEHEREADQTVVKPARPRRLPLYAEKMRDSYQRNRHNRSKDFEKIYFDRLKDRRKRDSPERGRDRKADNGGNKISRMEHRYMFEMKMREKEERKREEEFMKRKWETEDPQNYWLQQNSNMYYGNQQLPMAPGQFIPSLPPPNFTPDASTMMTPPPTMISNLATHPPSRSLSSHAYYNPPPTYVSPNIMLTHLPPPPTPSPLSSQPPTMLPAQQTYYQNSFANNTPPPLPVPYPHHNISELTAAVSAVASTCPPTLHTTSGHHQLRADMEQESAQASYAYDYLGHQSMHGLHTPVDEIPIPSDEQAPAYADSHHSYEYEKSVATTAATSVTSGHELQLLQLLQENQLQQELEQQQEAPVCSAKELSAALAAVAASDLSKIKLPPKWKAVRDAEGRVYYYHTKTRVSQWYPPPNEPAAAEVVEQVEEGDYSSEDESSADEEDEVVETRKRRRSSKYDHVNVLTKRLHRDGAHKDKEQSSFDMDAELRENLAAMSSEFQDSDNEDYSPVTKDIEEGKRDVSDNEHANNAKSPPSTIPLITEHIISPREPIDEKERIRNKRRIKMLKERFRRQKKQKLLESLNGENAGVMDGSNGVSLGDSISSSSNKLLSVPADTSNLTDRKRKDIFRSNMANFVVSCLNPFFRRGCTAGRITNGEDFKHLARKLTHFVMMKELKHCRNATDLTCSSSVKHKAKEYIKKYMSKFGEVYVRPPDE